MDEVLTGGCLCGQARYTVRTTIKFQSYACHCKDCQTRTGSAFGLQLAVLAGDLTVDGEVINGSHVQPSGATAGIIACRQCLTRLYTTNDRRPGIVNLRAGTLDNSMSLVPGFHLWVSSKQPWIVIPDDVPALETQPSDPAEWQRLLRSSPVSL